MKEKEKKKKKKEKRKKKEEEKAGFLHNNVVDGDVDQLHEESHKAHEEEADSNSLADLEILWKKVNGKKKSGKHKKGRRSKR